MMTTRRKTKCEPLEEALKQHGFASRYASAAVDYTQDAALVAEVVPHDPWSDRAHYVGLVDAAKLRANKTAPFLAIVPMHAGSWRAAHWVFPPKNPNLFEQLLSWKDGAVEMRWTIRAEFGWHSRVRFGKQADDGGWPGGGPVSGVHRHFFSDSADYLRAIGDYSPTFLRPDDPIARDLSVPEALRWTRQVLFLKGRRSGGPGYFPDPSRPQMEKELAVYLKARPEPPPIGK
jgi:hypothetical protein